MRPLTEIGSIIEQYSTIPISRRQFLVGAAGIFGLACKRMTETPKPEPEYSAELTRQMHERSTMIFTQTVKENIWDKYGYDLQPLPLENPFKKYTLPDAYFSVIGVIGKDEQNFHRGMRFRVTQRVDPNFNLLQSWVTIAAPVHAQPITEIQELSKQPPSTNRLIKVAQTLINLPDGLDWQEQYEGKNVSASYFDSDVLIKVSVISIDHITVERLHETATLQGKQ